MKMKKICNSKIQLCVLVLGAGVCFFAGRQVTYTPNQIPSIENSQAVAMEEPTDNDSSFSVEEEIESYISQHKGTELPSFYLYSDSEELSSSQLPNRMLIAIVDVGCPSCLDIIHSYNTLNNAIPTYLIADVNPEDLALFKQDNQIHVPMYYGHNLSEIFDMVYYPTLFVVENNSIKDIFVGNVPSETIISSLNN